MRPTRDEMREQLREIAEQPAPAPRPEFIAGLGARLTDPGDRLSPVIELHPSGRRVVRPVLSGVAAAVAALALAGSFAGWFDGSDEATRVRVLALAAAVDTVVVMPDGHEVLGTVGLSLPDATIVRTGPNGSATVGRMQLGPQQEAVVDAGQLRLRPPIVDTVGTATTKNTVPTTGLTTGPTTSTTTKRPGSGPTLPTLPFPG